MEAAQERNSEGRGNAQALLNVRGVTVRPKNRTVPAVIRVAETSVAKTRKL